MPYKDREKQRAYLREYKRAQRAGIAETPCKTLLPMTFKLQTAQDILNLLAEQVALVRSDKESGTLEKARCIGYLAGISLKAVETVSIEQRVAALEQILNERKKQA